MESRPSDRQLVRIARRQEVEKHLKQVAALLSAVESETKLNEDDKEMERLKEEVVKHQREAEGLLERLSQAETFLERVLKPGQHAGSIDKLQKGLLNYDKEDCLEIAKPYKRSGQAPTLPRFANVNALQPIEESSFVTKDLRIHDENRSTMTKRRQDHQKDFDVHKGPAGDIIQVGSGVSPILPPIGKSIFPSKSDKTNTVNQEKSTPFVGETKHEGGSRSPTSPTLKRIQESIFTSKSDTTKTVKHMKSSPAIGGSGSKQPTSTTGAGNNLTIPSNYQALHGSFVDLQSSYAESIKDDAGCFSGLLPGSKVALKKETLHITPSSPGTDQEELTGASSPALGDIGQQSSVADGSSNTDTPKWTPGGPIVSKESMDLMDREWLEKNGDAMAETKARFLREASSSYQSYAPVRQEYDIYNPPPREPTPTMDPPSLPPPPRRRRQLAPIVTESEPKEETKEEEGSETVVRHRKKGKSKTRSPRSVKGNTSPRTPSEVTENVFGAPESGEDSNSWPKQGLLQIQGRDADDPLAQWNRGRESFEAA
ncbi:hypothetical protein D9613_009898 [Agrocybe pediades]|uniref:Uncharacterized protein n=1 Tax=Agrocybe pediades TaxID=84607 RepID=A0A8H4QYS0_9AGAR|nr:hypothetical protein D9613_009898 [Agrocybe pediades]